MVKKYIKGVRGEIIALDSIDRILASIGRTQWKNGKYGRIQGRIQLRCLKAHFQKF